MPTSATGNSRATSARAGFTLVELLVALAVIGLSTAVVVIAWPRENAVVRQTAERLAARLTRAAHQSVLTGMPHGLVIDATGARFLRREHATWRPVPADAQPRAIEWPRGVAVALERPGSPKPDRGDKGKPAITPMIVFDPFGGADAFVVAVSGAGFALAVKAGADGRIVLLPMDTEVGDVGR